MSTFAACTHATAPRRAPSWPRRAGYALILTALLFAARQTAETGSDAPPDCATQTAAPAEPAAPAAAGAAMQARRLAVPPPDDGGGAPAAPATFAEFVAAIVALGVETSRLVEAGQIDEARASDERVRELFAGLVGTVVDADHEALAELASDGDPQDHLGKVRFAVLWRILENGLAARARLGERADGTRVDAGLNALVAGVLTTLPGSELLAHELGSRLLVDAPYLDEPHEPAVLELVAMAGEQRFPAKVATALLSTLWHNLERRGVRTTDQLRGLALLLLDSGNASERMAAGRLLLADDRFRLVVLDHLQRTRDVRLARELATAAAQDLPPATAFSVLAVAAAIDPTATAPFLLLGHRAADLVRREYELRLADDVEPRLRQLLVAGAGFSGSADGIELARLAFASDPDPDVRLRALFVLTGRAAEALGEAAMVTAIADPELGQDPRCLASLVAALENLARAGMTNAVDRVGNLLRATHRLDAASTAALDGILSAALPGASRLATR